MLILNLNIMKNKFKYFYVKGIIAVAALLLCCNMAYSQDLKYQRPPKAIEDLILAPATPSIMLSPNKQAFAVLSISDIPSIEEQSKEELKLAGVRTLQNTNAPKYKTKIKGIEIKAIKGNPINEGVVKGFTNDVNILSVIWAPNAKYLLATVEQENGVYLWLVDAANLSAKQLSNTPLNLFFGSRMIQWAPDSKSIVAAFIPKDRGAAPLNVAGAIAPVIQTSEGKSTPARTYQDLLIDKYSCLQFDYYASSEILSVSIEDGSVNKLAEAGIIPMLNYSPNGEYLLMQEISTPYSYVVPYTYFPTTTKVINIKTKEVKNIYTKPLIETDFISKNSTSPYPRAYGWRADMPATLYWVEPLDGGDGKLEVENRDILMTLAAPFTAKPSQLAKTQYRFSDVVWGDANNAFVLMYDFATRMEKCLYINPSNQSVRSILYHQSTEDLYADKGDFVTQTNESGQRVVFTPDKYKTIYFKGKGYSPQGALPFLDSYNLKAKTSKRLWQSENPYFENIMDFIDLSKGDLITMRESNTQNPNYYLRNIKKKTLQQLTYFADPYPSMQGVSKQVIEYTRKDGVKLSGTLYLPAGYKKENGPLPVLIWAYPSEYKNKDNAGQRGDAPNQFIRYTRLSPVLFVAAGYAVLNDASFPIIGEGDKEPNDTYVEQLVNNASAAIDKLVDMGVGDRSKMAVGGHSYGAFMTANLLANSNLFAAGIARSGAYNRTLTPFGFQNEMRTFWQVPSVYLEMSPFVKADRLKTPILLIHGQADNNSGTFTMQSERLYSALKGNGGTARLVLLPYESHGYSARESILHQAWETFEWLEKYVKR